MEFNRELLKKNESMKVSATFLSVFKDLFNLALTLMLIIWIGFFALLAFADESIVALIPMSLGLICLVLYLWAVLTRSFEINQQGIIYKEAFRTVNIAWDEIDAVLIENGKKQITFYRRGKRIRIHAFGLNPDSLSGFGKLFFNELTARNIEVIVHE